MAGSLALVMYWAVCTTLFSALRSEAEQLPYKAVMQSLRMLSKVQLQNLLRIWGPMSNLFSPLRGNRFCRALFTTVLVCLDYVSLLVMWMPLNLKILKPTRRNVKNPVNSSMIYLILTHLLVWWSICIWFQWSLSHSMYNAFGMYSEPLTFSTYCFG
jgi:hypothetical protein